MSSIRTKAVGGGIGATIAAIIAGVIAIEGGYVNDPRDPGGATKYGITERVARASGYRGNMKDLPEDTAFHIYFEDYVTKPNFTKIVELSPAVGEKIVDAGVNTGTSRSGRWLQTALNAYNTNQISVDGIVGNGTINALERLQRARGNQRACELLLKSIDAQQYMHYHNLTNMRQYMVGWVDHRIGNVPLDKCADE